MVPVLNIDVDLAAAIDTSKLSGPVTSIPGHGLGSLATLNAVSGGEGGTITDSTIVDADVSSISTAKITGLGALATLGAVSGGSGGTITDATITNADIATNAAIAYSKLALTGSIVNADINASAAIVDTKLATISTPGKVSGTAVSGAVASADYATNADHANSSDYASTSDYALAADTANYATGAGSTGYADYYGIGTLASASHIGYQSDPYYTDMDLNFGDMNDPSIGHPSLRWSSYDVGNARFEFNYGLYAPAFSGDGSGLTNVGSLASGSVSDAEIAVRTGLSVMGRNNNSPGSVADIVAASDFQVMRRSGTNIGFGAINLASSAAVTGLLADANLSTNVPLKNGTNSFTGANTFGTNVLTASAGVQTNSNFATPANSSTGAKLWVYGAAPLDAADGAIGYMASYMFSQAASGDGFKWYTGFSNIATLSSSGGFTASSFTGSGSGLFSVPDSALSSNIPLKNAANTFTAAQTVTVSSGDALTANANSAASVGMHLQNNSANASAYTALRLSNDASTNAGIYRLSSTNSNFAGANSLMLYQGSANPIGFVTNNAVRSTLTGAGNWALGTGYVAVGSLTAPTSGGMLQVKNTAAASTNSRFIDLRQQSTDAWGWRVNMDDLSSGNIMFKDLDNNVEQTVLTLGRSTSGAAAVTGNLLVGGSTPSSSGSRLNVTRATAGASASFYNTGTNFDAFIELDTAAGASGYIGSVGNTNNFYTNTSPGDLALRAPAGQSVHIGQGSGGDYAELQVSDNTTAIRGNVTAVTGSANSGYHAVYIEQTDDGNGTYYDGLHINRAFEDSNANGNPGLWLDSQLRRHGLARQRSELHRRNTHRHEPLGAKLHPVRGHVQRQLPIYGYQEWRRLRD